MKKYIRVNQQSYDELCDEYNKRSVYKNEFEESTTTLGNAVMKYVKKPIENTTLLEVGPGSGDMLLFFEQNGCRTIAVELSRKIASLAQKRSPHSTILIGDISKFEFLDDSFEIIYAGALIHLFPLKDARDLLSKFYKWLKPEGTFFVNTTIHKSSKEGYYEKHDYGKLIKRFRRFWTEPAFLKELVNTGFEIIDRRSTDEQNRQKQWVAFLCTKK